METLFKRLLDYYQITKEDYQNLIKPVDEDNFDSGHSFQDMDQVVALVKEAVNNHKKIFIYGDYDCDGIMSISILVKMFQYIDYPVSYHVPNRYLDGYGLTRKRAEQIVDAGYDVCTDSRCSAGGSGSIQNDKSIEEDYINAMNRLDTDTVGIAMAGSSFFSEQETIMLLQQVPETWFRVYSKIEPKVSRRIETVDYVNKVGAAVSTDGWLISLDRARVICEDLCDSCDDYLNSLARGKKIALPSGETIELLRAKLDDLRKNRIDPLLLLASENPNCQTPLDTVFIKSRILFLENKIHELQEKYNALTTAINILQSDNPSTAKNQPAVSGKEESLSLTIDSSFIVAISDLVMKSQSIDLRKKYADEAIQCKEEVVHLESEKNYYLSFLQATPHTDGKDMLPQEQFDKLSKAMFAELLDVCKKLNEMETLVLEDYYNSSVFFTASGETEKKVSPFIPFIYITFGMIALMFAIDFGYIGFEFYMSVCAEKK